VFRQQAPGARFAMAAPPSFLEKEHAACQRAEQAGPMTVVATASRELPASKLRWWDAAGRKLVASVAFSSSSARARLAPAALWKRTAPDALWGSQLCIAPIPESCRRFAAPHTEKEGKHYLMGRYRPPSRIHYTPRPQGSQLEILLGSFQADPSQDAILRSPTQRGRAPPWPLLASCGARRWGGLPSWRRADRRF
jgi:hypothetical protein